MNRALTLLRTAWALGLPSIARVLTYRLGIRLGLNPVRRLRATLPEGPFWQPPPPLPAVAAPAVAAWRTTGLLFGHMVFPLGAGAPDWLSNPVTGETFPEAGRKWWQIPDFDPSVGDIKLIWELSRMDWILAMAQQVRHGDGAALTRMNEWLADWCRRNPPYAGPNWKCGQEASIRVMHLAMAALLLGQVDMTSSGLRDLIHVHLRRIAPTLSYAIGQDNNHGTSEAAALFIGGSWLQRLGVGEAAQWAQQGQRWLVERARHLISEDGSFSQYSLNYHRVMLDTYSMAEVWRRHMALESFPAAMVERLHAAGLWLRDMVNPVDGDAPNLGANDGARLLPLADVAHRDFRPSVQLAVALFSAQRAYAEAGVWDDPLLWLGLPHALPAASVPVSRLADGGGYAILRRGPTMAMLRYPRFRFRPSQSDALHLDLWRGAENLLRDAGTLSYAAAAQRLDYFGGPAGHNTIQFDDRSQMPRLGRFLLGDWLETSHVEAMRHEQGQVRFGAGYRDAVGAEHVRRVALSDAGVTVVDEVSGFARKAVLRWRLAPAQWSLHGTTLRNAEHCLTVQADVPVVRCEVVGGWESRHYLEKTRLPVLEVEIAKGGSLVSEYRWSA